MTTEKFTFPGAAGDELAARLDLPPHPPRALVLFAHCFTCGKDIAAASRIARGLVGAGFGVLRFDFTGLGSSQGEFANTNFSSNVEDLVAAAAALRDRLTAPALLVGHSLGGAAVLAAASRIPEVRGVVTLAAPSDPAHVVGVFDDDARATIARDGEANVSLAGRGFRIKEQFLRDVSNQQLDEAVGALGAALLVLHAPTDELVSVEHARRIYEAARHPKSFVAVDGADHLLTDRRDAAWVASVIAAWAERYLPEEDDADAPAPPPEGVVVVEETGAGPFSQQVFAGSHSFPADEPKGIGDDTGPSPYDLLLAGLGACTAMTMRMYARRRDIALEQVRVHLRHERRHAADSAGAEGQPRTIAHITREIELHGDLTDEQRAKLFEIADKCPVHRTLEGEIRVDTAERPPSS